MIAHIGIDSFSGWASVLYIHDNGEKEVKKEYIKQVESSKDINDMFIQLKKKINVPLDCICVCDLRCAIFERFNKQYINMALKNGFKKVEVINHDTAKYFFALSYLNIKIKQSNIIWLYDVNEIQIWKSGKCLEQIFDASTMQQKKMLKSKQPAYIAIFGVCNNIIEELVKTILPHCNIKKLVFREHHYAKLALIYAEIMAGERKIYADDDLQTNVHYKKVGKVVPNIVSVVSPIQANRQPGVNLQTIVSRAANKIDNTAASLKNKTLSATYKDHSYLFPNKPSRTNAQIGSLGIDLGTSRCCAAVNRKNGIETVALDYKGERLLPSYVSYNEKTPICGQLVIDRLRHYAKYTVFDSKRIIGRMFDDIEIDSNWYFELTEINKKVFIEIKKADNRRGCVSAEKIAADLLKHVKRKSEEFQGTKLNNVVITVPAAFTESQKSATENAGKLAGFTNIHLLPEPIAAAFAYFIDRPIPNNSKVLVFDLGGGTLDVCIFKIESNQLHIISNTGDSKLGGRDFDTVLINYFNNQLGSKYAIKLLHERKYQLMTKCQTIKENLSVLNESFLDIDEVDNTQAGIIPVTRTEFEKMTQNLLNRIKNTVNAALMNSSLSANQINKVLQVGGGSRMPMIKRLLQQLFPSSEHICEEHPEEVVAIGAAYYAYSIFSNNKT